MNAWLRTLWQRIWGVRPWGSSKGGQSWRMFPFRESGCCLWGSNSNISCPLWCLLHLNVSLCSHLISHSTFQLGIPNHTLFFQDKYARGGIYYYSSILNTWGKVLVNSHFSLIIIIKHHDNGEKRWILGLMPVISEHLLSPPSFLPSSHSSLSVKVIKLGSVKSSLPHCLHRRFMNTS